MVTACHDPKKKRDTHRETVHFYTACSEFELGLELQGTIPPHKVSPILEAKLGMTLDRQYFPLLRSRNANLWCWAVSLIAQLRYP